MPTGSDSGAGPGLFVLTDNPSSFGNPGNVEILGRGLVESMQLGL